MQTEMDQAVRLNNAAMAAGLDLEKWLLEQLRELDSESRSRRIEATRNGGLGGSDSKLTMSKVA